MDKNSHNLAAAKKEGRVEFAREVQMLVDEETAQGSTDAEILSFVTAKVTEEVNS